MGMLALLLVVGCAKAPSPSPAAAAGGSRDSSPELRVEPGAPAAGALLPSVFTPEQLQAIHRVGKEYRYEFREGDDTWTERWSVTAASANGCTFTYDTQRGGTEETEARSTSWAELAAHAAFPAGTTAADGEVTVPAGTFAARTFTLPPEGGATTTMSFDLAHPGPPIRLIVTAGGAPVTTMELVSRSRP